MFEHKNKTNHLEKQTTLSQIRIVKLKRKSGIIKFKVKNRKNTSLKQNNVRLTIIL